MSEEKDKTILSPSFRFIEDPEMGDVLILTEPWKFKTSKGEEYTIPVGYESDGMSVPRFFFRVLSARIDFRTTGPSIVHDFRYENHIGTRAECDADYRADLIANGFPRVKAYAVWLGVRIGGRSHY